MKSLELSTKVSVGPAASRVKAPELCQTSVGGSATSKVKAPELHQTSVGGSATSKVKAPELHQTSIGESATSKVKDSEKKKSSDFKYDIFGWVILAVGIITWVGISKAYVPPPSSRWLVSQL